MGEETKRIFRIAVCDDEQIALNIIHRNLKLQLDKMQVSYELACYSDAKELRNSIFRQKQYDILFLDIDMPGLNGIELGEHLRKHQYDSFIVFISNRSDLVFDSLKIQPFRFVRKNRFREEIGIVIKDLMDAFVQKEAGYLLLKQGQTVFKVNPYEIVYVESQRKIQCVHMVEQKIEITDSFTNLKEQLSDFGFIQTHRSYLVNYRFIASIQKSDLMLDNGEWIPVGRQRIREVKEEFQRLSLKF